METERKADNETMPFLIDRRRLVSDQSLGGNAINSDLTLEPTQQQRQNYSSNQ
ncbi:hypothetical protein RMSM_00566 [Rhodopirellula maiorica SM1]|uniref:Uncharacterized protein n=1 Tax=Rhodopirellula maiorica SM1 TaxID=1265738 RepID=M5RT35_9BACT|nr:hypothetical protein RMSM_00566 [Rhodopirellula maiorica SM1]